MEAFSVSLALCEGNPPVTGGFPSQRLVTELWCFLDLRLSKRMSQQSRRRWLETPSHTLWRHCNGCFSSPVDCPAGYYVSSPTSCEPCPVAFYQPKRNQTECILCPRGHITPSPQTVSNTSCVVGQMDWCSAGAYACPDNSECVLNSTGGYHCPCNVGYEWIDPICKGKRFTFHWNIVYTENPEL